MCEGEGKRENEKGADRSRGVGRVWAAWEGCGRRRKGVGGPARRAGRRERWRSNESREKKEGREKNSGMRDRERDTERQERGDRNKREEEERERESEG